MTTRPAPDQTARIHQIVADFTAAYLRDILHRLNQITPAAWYANSLQNLSTTPPQPWLDMALYGAGITDAPPAEIRHTCQSLADLLFAIPGHAAYTIPDAWYATDLGALWAAALIRAEGDDLITIVAAAEIAGVSRQAIAQRIDRGDLRAYINPANPARQGRRLLRRRDITP
jgi:hypothetical protein